MAHVGNKTTFICFSVVLKIRRYQQMCIFLSHELRSLRVSIFKYYVFGIKIYLILTEKNGEKMFIIFLFFGGFYFLIIF